MSVNIPSTVQSQFQNFRTRGTFGEGSKREVLDETTIGGAKFVVAVRAQSLTSIDEVQGSDAACHQPGYVEFTPQAVKDLDGLFGPAKNIKVAFDSKSEPTNRTIDMELVDQKGATFYGQIASEGGLATNTFATETPAGYQFEGVYLNEKTGCSWTEGFLLAK